MVRTGLFSRARQSHASRLTKRRGQTEVNLEMVRTGNAWVFLKYYDGAGLPAQETEARS